MKTHCILPLCVSLLLAFGLSSEVPAQDKQELTQPQVPLEQLLNRDGTLDLNRGFHGSLDPAGWQMTTGPNGEPRFVPASTAQQSASAAQLMAVPGDENWDDRFGAPGPNGRVTAIAVNGNDVYAGGRFTTAGGVLANYIAKWNGTSWSPLGSGMNGYVYAIAVNGSEVYAGGVFTTAGGVPASYIAKWNGTSWSALGSAMNGYVDAIAVSGSDVYAGGWFNIAGGISANYIAKWNGTSWSALGSGMNAGVNAITVSGSEVYAGGDFTTAGGIPANRIAKWNGTSWSALGSGLNGYVVAIAVSGSEVYAAGGFGTVDGVAANHIAKWNGTSWSALGSGMNGDINAIAISGSEVYAGGDFTIAGGIPASNIAVWDGTSWSLLGSGLIGTIYAIAVSGSEVYMAGQFSTAGEVAASHIAKWNGTSWSALHASNQNGVNIDVYAIAVNGSEVYVGGLFVTAGGVVANGIAKWNGMSWSALGSGVKYGIVYAIAVSGSDVYVGGMSINGIGVLANSIAKWDGTSWSALGSGMNRNGAGYAAVYTLAVSGSDLYAGGYFTTAGGVPANYIARWNGTSWSALGSGMNSYVQAIAVSGSEVYAGGYFTIAGGVPANYIAKWNGTSWFALGSGMNRPVSAIALNGGKVYAGGQFTTAGGIPASNIAAWDGTSWSALGSGMNGYVNAISISGSEMYAGGDFTTAGGIAANHIAKWNGTSWSTLGNGLNGYVIAIAVSNSDLYAGGIFTTAGGKPSSNFGRHVLNAPPTVSAGGPYNVNEGGSVTATATGNDPEIGPLTYAWDLDNNGSFETPGQSVTFSAASLDGPSSQTIKVQVTDNGGLTASAQTTVNVINVAPTATFTATPTTIIVGQSSTLAFSNQSDPSPADVSDGFKYSYDCTNDGTFEASDVTATSNVCVYPASGTFTAKGRIKDKDGGFTDYTVQVKVQTPREATGSLIDQVQALIDAGILNGGQGNALITKLRVAIQKLDKGPAIQLLQAFIDQVNDFMSSTPPILTAAEGQPLIDAANAIIAALSNPSKASIAGIKKDASDGLTAIASGLPTGFQLEQNSPNPFNPVTTIQFSVPRESFVRLKVYNSFGAEVAMLVDRQVAAGTYKVNWDASRLASGFYLYRLEADGFAQTKKLLLMK